MEELITRKDKLKQVKNAMEEFERMLKLLHETHKLRKEKYDRFQTFITTRCKRIFAALLHKRGYRGEVSIDHHKEELDLIINVEQQVEEDEENRRSGKNPQSLSGGEKSYSTVCLLLALWQSMYSPFRCLDEFDVFMDAVNRRLAMKLIIENARDTATNCQYVLITPQAMGNVQGIGGPDIRAIMLQQPERNQQRLAFSQP